MKCKHCGKEIDESKSISIRFKTKEDNEWKVVSLCEECDEELTYIVEQFCMRGDE